jgi:putative nucleotidyltransferase with HDIG domain
MKKNSIQIPVYIYFIIVTLLIIVLFPKEGKFRYAFVEGRPWEYGLLTAPFDFPVLKTASELKAEQDTVTQNFVPYFENNRTVGKQQIERFRAAANNRTHTGWTPEYERYVEKMMNEVYAAGIVSVNDYQYLRDNHYNTFMVFENQVAVPYSSNDVFTVKSAYSCLLDNCPDPLNRHVLGLGNMNDYLHNNLQYDAVTSDKVKQDLLQQLSPSSGMVQAGEKIIDRGEIVNAKTYNILRSLRDIYNKESGLVIRQSGLIAGTFILVTGLMACFFFYLSFFRKRIFQLKNSVFLLSMLSLFTFLTEICVSYNFFNVYIIPYAIIPIVIRTFFDSRTAHFTHFITILICSLMLPFPYEFILMQLIVCMVATYILRDLTQRSELIQCSFYILVAYIVTYLGFFLLREGDLAQINWYMFLYFGINFLFVMFTYPFIYIIEKIFGYISNVTLVELSDITRPALTLLSESSPGTFQHSLQVSMLGTAAAVKVSANPQLIRTGALYHDLGKVVNPGFFIENVLSGNNPHDQLPPEESARIITGHVPDGVKKAAEFGLPPAIVKFILTHHGKGKAKYFYTTYKNQHPDQPVDERIFSYEGMNPDTKETAILMMADAVEAASRSLKDYSEESIRNLVNNIIDSQIADGLLNEAPLTFQNITDIKHVFIEKLVSIYHSRIAYPELSKKQE